MTRSNASSARAWIIGLGVMVVATGQCLAQVVINEVLAENRLTILDEDLDDADWLELFNRGDTPQSIVGYALSDDPSDPRKWMFPDLVLGPGEYALVWCSGKDRTAANKEAIERPETTVPFAPSLVPLDADWQYLTGSPETGPPPDGWNELGFDDTDWTVGKPGFGFGDEDVQTILPMDIGVVFFRHVFHVTAEDIPSHLVLRACYDDGILVFLNGSLVLSENVRDGDLTFASMARASGNCEGDELFDLSELAHLLTPGENLLAIALLNIRPNNNDLNLRAELGTALPVLHTNFKIKKGGETIFLTDSAGTLVDAVTLPRQAEDHSFGRIPNGEDEFFYLLHPTPARANETRSSTQLIPEAPSFEPGSGRYRAPVDVTLSADTTFADFELRYTLDGTVPSPTSLLFEASIRIAGDTVVRAAGFLNGEAITRVVSSSYFLSPLALDLTLPVLSVSMEPDDFKFVHLSNDFRGPNGEREAYLEVFNPDGSLGTDTGFGLRLHGGAGRRGDFGTQKAYKAYFRRTYGDKKLHYPMFPGIDVDDFDRLVWRIAFNDSFRAGNGTYLRDQLIRDLHEETGGLVTHGHFYHLFVNMEYRGLYNVVERMDDSFFQSHLPNEGGDWDVIKFGLGEEALEGTPHEWGRLKNFMHANDLKRDDLYEEAIQLLDLENFTSYMIINLWAQNHDWPQQNWYTARSRRDDSYWRFLIWDAESGLGPGAGQDSLAHVFSRGVASALTIIFKNLLESDRYQKFFLDEMERYFSTTLSPENVVSHIDRLADLVGDDVEHFTAPSGFEVDTWHSNVAGLRDFARERIPVMREFVLASDRFTVAPDVPFRRGDANGDGSLNVVDPIRILDHLLFASEAPVCTDALDVDDLGNVNITDAIFLLNFLFQHAAPAPAPPHGECGPDGTTDSLSCQAPTTCR
jgi:hypothetical protein